MKIRAFIAVDPPDPVVEEIVKFLSRLEKETRGVRWVNPDGVHLTLRFLGGVEAETLAQIQSRMKRVAEGFGPFSLCPSGLGFFPHISRPRIVWVGLTGETERLKALQSAVAEGVADLPVKPEEKRDFHPHLTLGRIRDFHQISGLVKIVEEGKGWEPSEFRVGEIILYKSDLTPKGARYTKLGTFLLGGRYGTNQQG